MTSAQRIALLVAAVIILGGAFVLASASDDGDDSTVATATTPAETTTVITTPTPTSTTAPDASVTPAEDPEPQFTTVVVRGGKPVGGLKTIKAQKGDRVRIEVSSPDTTDELHLHGYDVTRELKAGGEVRFSFDAELEGIFELELEGTGVQVAKLEVSPS